MFHEYAFMFLFSTVLLSLYRLISSVNLVRGDNLNPGIYSIDSSPKGVKYQEWTASFWQWLYSLTPINSPREIILQRNVQTDKKSRRGFLKRLSVGSKRGHVHIPAGMPILAAILNGQCDTSDSSLHTDEDIRKCATEGNDYGVISGTLDGVPLKNLDKYRTDSGFYNITHVADNIYDLPAGGPYRAFTNGYFVFLRTTNPR